MLCGLGTSWMWLSFSMITASNQTNFWTTWNVSWSRFPPTSPNLSPVSCWELWACPENISSDAYRLAVSLPSKVLGYSGLEDGGTLLNTLYRHIVFRSIETMGSWSLFFLKGVLGRKGVILLSLLNHSVSKHINTCQHARHDWQLIKGVSSCRNRCSRIVDTCIKLRIKHEVVQWFLD